MSAKSEVKFAFVKYSTGEKEIVSIDKIKGFNPKNINFDKKYKILWNDTYYDGVIIDVSNSEEVLEKKITEMRPRLRPMDYYMSASDSDIGCKSEADKNKNIKEDKTSEKEQLLAKKIKDISNRKPNATNYQMNIKEDKISEKETLSVKKVTDVPNRKPHATNNQMNIKEGKISEKETLIKEVKDIPNRKRHATNLQNFKEVERLIVRKEAESLRKQIAQLKLSVQNKDAIADEFLKANLTLQKDVIKEIQELKNIIIAKQTNEKNKGQCNETDFPVGYRRETDNNIHVGQNIWISSQVYDSAVCISKSPSVFTKNMALAIFGAQVLKDSTVTGTVSNRIKGRKTVTPRPMLDPKRFLALKDIVRYWLYTVKKFDEMAVDLEVNLVSKHVSQKIYELNRGKKIKNIEHDDQSTVEEPDTKESEADSDKNISNTKETEADSDKENNSNTSLNESKE